MLTKKEKQDISDAVCNFKTSSKLGFTMVEIQILLLKYPNINNEKFTSAMSGNTCGMENGIIRNYTIDVYHAIIAGLENRELTIDEWD